MAVTRELGVVYTPPAVTTPMVRKALEPLVAGRTAEQILALRICDPAVGIGAFAIAAIDYLAESTGASRSQVARCIVGVDIDARAAAEARRATGAQIVVGDALTLDWSTRFPDGFDAVIGNPPYIRQERLAAEHKKALHGFEVYDGVADLYVYFVELAHRVLRPGGRYCLIVPNKWMTAAYGRPLRSYLAARASLEGVVDFGRSLPLFAGADAFPCVMWGAIGTGSPTIIASRADTTIDAALELGAPHARARWTAEPWHIDTAADRALIDRLEARFPALGTIVDAPSRGVITGCNRAFVIDATTRRRIVDTDPASDAFIRPFAKGRDIRRWAVADAERYIIMADHDVELSRGCLAHLAQFRDALEPKPDGWRDAWHGRKPGTYRWHELQDPVGPLVASRRPRLLYQDIQTEPACALDRTGAYVPDTTVWMLPTDDLAVLAILNSSLYRWYARRRFPPALNGAVRPKRDYMRMLPIARSRELHAVDDASVDEAVFDAYELTLPERERIATDSASE